MSKHNRERRKAGAMKNQTETPKYIRRLFTSVAELRTYKCPRYFYVVFNKPCVVPNVEVVSTGYHPVISPE